MQPSKLAQYQAYALANQTAPKTRQIVMLYDGVIRNLRQARDAIEEKRIEDRYNLLVKASEILLGLQGCLDFEQGDQVAKLLYDFYSSVDSRILSLHRNQSIPMCDALIQELKQMRDAWSAVDQQAQPVAAASPAYPAAGIDVGPEASDEANEPAPMPLPSGFGFSA